MPQVILIARARVHTSPAPPVPIEVRAMEKFFEFGGSQTLDHIKLLKRKTGK